MSYLDYVDKNWTWYAELYCRDLGLQHSEEGGEGFGGSNYDASRIAEFAKYYLSNPEHSRVGREMLLYLLFDSVNDRFWKGAHLSEYEEYVLRKATAAAMSDRYDCDIVRWQWDHEPDPHGETPMFTWIKRNFPGWKPPPSIWAEPSGQ